MKKVRNAALGRQWVGSDGWFLSCVAVVFEVVKIFTGMSEA